MHGEDSMHTQLRHITLCTFGALAFLTSSALAKVPEAPSFFWQDELLIPKTDHDFQIDGEVSEAARHIATAARNFLQFRPVDPPSDTRTTVYFAHTGSHLYVGFTVDWIEDDPPRATARERDDTDLWRRDDSMELLIEAPGQLYSFIGNSEGVVADMHHTPRDRGWSDERWNYAARQNDGGWEGEFLIPAAVFGIDRFEQGSRWQMEVFQSAKSSISTSWAYTKGQYGRESRSRYPYITFGGDAHSPITLARPELGELGDNRIGFKHTLKNAAKASLPVDVWAAFYEIQGDGAHVPFYPRMAEVIERSGDVDITPGLTEATRLELAVRLAMEDFTQMQVIENQLTVDAGGSLPVEIDRPRAPGMYLMAWRIKDPKTDDVIHAGVHPFNVQAPLQTAIEYHYLHAQEIEARTLVPRSLAREADTIGYEIRHASTGAVVTSRTLDAERVSAGHVVAVFDTTAWPVGSYAMTIKAMDAAGQVVQKYDQRFERPANPWWWQTDAGRLVEVPWPWEPVQTNDGATMVWGRTFQWDGASPLPRQVISQDEPIFHQAPQIRITIAGQTRQWQVESFELANAQPGKAVYEGVFKADEVALHTTATVEFDGLIKFDWVLKSTEPTVPARVDELILELPVHRDHAQMYGRPGALGLPPVEEDTWPDFGYFVDVNEALTFPFAPVLQVYSEWRGLEWVADQDWDWSNADDEHKMELSPEGDAVVMRARLIDAPTTVDEPRTFTFGLQVWPAKPWPDEPYNVTRYLERGSSTAARMSRGVEGMRDAMKHHANVLWVFHWMTDHEAGRLNPNYPQFPSEQKAQEVSQWGHWAQEAGIAIIGHDLFALPSDNEDFADWGMEMVRRPLVDRGANRIYPAPTPVFQDALAGRYRQFAEDFGWSGIQYDGTFGAGTRRSYSEDVRSGFAYVDDEEHVHGSYTIFAWREFARRIYNVFIGGEVDFPGMERGFLYNHKHNTTGAIDVFTSARQSGESPHTMLAGSLQDIDFERERASLGHHPLGMPHHWLRKERQTRVGLRGRIAFALQFNMNMAHNMMLSQLDQNDYEPDSYPIHKLWAARQWVNAHRDNFHGYWRNDSFLRTDRDNTYLGFYLQPSEKVLLAVTNAYPEARRLQVTLDLEALGFDHGATLSMQDAITEVMLPIDDGTFEIDVAADGYRLLKIWRK